MLYGVQVLAAAFALVMAYQTYIHLRRGDLNGSTALLWELVWAGLLLVSVLPEPFQRFVGAFHVARLLDLVAIAALLLLAAITYRLHVAVRRLDGRLEKLVRQLALDRAGSGPEPVDDPQP